MIASANGWVPSCRVAVCRGGFWSRSRGGSRASRRSSRRCPGVGSRRSFPSSRDVSRRPADGVGRSGSPPPCLALVSAFGSDSGSRTAPFVSRSGALPSSPGVPAPGFCSRPDAVAPPSSAPLVLAPPPVPQQGAYFGFSTSREPGESAIQAIERSEAALGRTAAIDHQFYRWDATFPLEEQASDAAAGRIPFISWKPVTSDGRIVPWAQVASGQEDDVIEEIGELAVVEQAETALGESDRCVFCDVMLAVPAAVAAADAGDLERASRHLADAEESGSRWVGSAWSAALEEARAHVAAASGDRSCAGARAASGGLAVSRR